MQILNEHPRKDFARFASPRALRAEKRRCAHDALRYKSVKKAYRFSSARSRFGKGQKRESSAQNAAEWSGTARWHNSCSNT